MNSKGEFGVVTTLKNQNKQNKNKTNKKKRKKKKKKTTTTTKQNQKKKVREWDNDVKQPSHLERFAIHLLLKLLDQCFHSHVSTHHGELSSHSAFDDQIDFSFEV